MSLRDMFRWLRRPAKAQPTTEPTDWSIVQAVDEKTGHAAVFRVRSSRPERPDIDSLSTAIVIKWPYQSTNPMPPQEVNQQQLAFETALDPLSSESELVQVATGMGLKEWIYYAKNRDDFMAELNQLLDGHPRYPIEIEFFDDPHWLIWADLQASLEKRTL